MGDSVIVRLKRGFSRDDVDDSSTLRRAWAGTSPPQFRDLFVENYESIRVSCEALPRPGVLVTVFGPSGFEGAATVPAKPDGIHALTIGSHSHAQLYLSGNGMVSLHHGIIIVYPAATGRVRFRVLDLLASRPFDDERGNRVAALEADGPVFLRAGEHSIFIFPCGDDWAPWSGPAERAWDAIPERLYLDEVRSELAEDRFRARSEGTGPGDKTLAQSVPGPVLELESLLEEGEMPRGELAVRSAEGEMTLPVGGSAARGVLLGRYQRCDGSRYAVLCGPSISRVHALVIEIAGQLYAVDAGSKNGLWLAGTRVPLAALRPGCPVALARTAATLEWSFLH